MFSICRECEWASNAATSIWNYKTFKILKTLQEIQNIMKTHCMLLRFINLCWARSMCGVCATIVSPAKVQIHSTEASSAGNVGVVFDEETPVSRKTIEMPSGVYKINLLIN